jgi:RNA polymerase sigma-70 factor, ECF subfamily
MAAPRNPCCVELGRGASVATRMTGAHETVLLQRLLRDDPAAWQEIVATYAGLLLAIARRTFAAYGFEVSTHDCEDVVAEVWGNLLRHERRLIQQCLARRQLLPTLHALTRNRSIDLMRRRKFVTQPLAGEGDELPAVDAESAPDAELASLLPQALAELSAKERTLVELFFLHGKKYREIELLTGVSQNSVGPTLTRALGKLRDWLAESRKELFATRHEP